MAIQLTEAYENAFVNAFYDQIEYNDAIGDNPKPWGCPWYYADESEWYLPDPVEAAIRWAEICRPEIEDLAKAEADEDED